MIEGHGDDIYRYAGKIKYNFSSNILNSIDHTLLKEYLKDRLDVIANYPEPAPFALEELLARKHNVNTENVMVTNGAVDAIYSIANFYREMKSCVIQPTFSEYVDACVISDHKVEAINKIGDIPKDADLVWICNPNNPTGEVFDIEYLKCVIDSNPNKMFIIDQAYHRYTSQPVLSAQDAIKRENLILIYSLTKDYSVPGLRLGYIVANKDISEKLHRRRIPWSVNAIGIEAAVFLLNHDNQYWFDPKILECESRRVASELSKMEIQCIPSRTNFILCCLPRGSAGQLKEYLVAKHGILIRDASNFFGLTERHFRIAVQSPQEDDLLIEAVKQWMHL